MKKLVCTMLSLLLCFLLPVSASALNISADRSASSVIETAPFSLVETNSPAGAVGIAYDLSEGTTRYLGVFGNVLSENDQILSVPGWFPQTASLLSQKTRNILQTLLLTAKLLQKSLMSLPCRILQSYLDILVVIFAMWKKQFSLLPLL